MKTDHYKLKQIKRINNLRFVNSSIYISELDGLCNFISVESSSKPNLFFFPILFNSIQNLCLDNNKLSSMKIGVRHASDFRLFGAWRNQKHSSYRWMEETIFHNDNNHMLLTLTCDKKQSYNIRKTVRNFLN